MLRDVAVKSLLQCEIAVPCSFGCFLACCFVKTLQTQKRKYAEVPSSNFIQGWVLKHSICFRKLNIKGKSLHILHKKMKDMQLAHGPSNNA